MTKLLDNRSAAPPAAASGEVPTRARGAGWLSALLPRGAQARARQARALLEGRALEDAPPLAQARRVTLRLPRRPPLAARHAGHLAAALIALAALLAPLPDAQRAAPAPPPASEGAARALPIAPAAAAVVLSEEALAPAAPAAAIEEREVYATYHTLAEGETLGEVAALYRVSVAALYWANALAADGVLAAGQDLRVPRVEGVPYVVQPGDTVMSIADRLGVSGQAITLFKPNGVRYDADLEVGAELFVPGGRLDYPRELLDRVGGLGGVADLRAVVVGSVYEDETNLRSGPGRAYPSAGQLAAGARLLPVARHAEWVKVEAADLGAGWVRADLIALPEATFLALPETNDFPPPPPRWVWPTYGQLTSPFGWRTVPFRSFHDGIDVANRAGTAIRAARAGRVYEAGWCRGFGYCVKIDHGEGVVTIYGHLLKRPVVSAGERVEAGDLIGAMGSTYDRAGGGYSTGVHLHFTIKVGGKAVNPLKYLP